MAVTTAPTNVTTFKIKEYQAVNPSANLTHVGLVSVAGGTTAQPGSSTGFFDVWYDLTNNKLIIDTTSTSV